MLHPLPYKHYISPSTSAAFSSLFPHPLDLLYMCLQIKAYRLYSLYVHTCVCVCVTWLLLLLSLLVADPNAFIRYVWVNNERFSLLIRSNSNRGSFGPHSSLLFLFFIFCSRYRRVVPCIPYFCSALMRNLSSQLETTRIFSAQYLICAINIIPILDIVQAHMNTT